MGNSTTLTKRIIDAGISQAQSDGLEKWLWDNRAPGLAIRIKPSGRATFVLRYRNAEGRLRIPADCDHLFRLIATTDSD